MYNGPEIESNLLYNAYLPQLATISNTTIVVHKPVNIV